MDLTCWDSVITCKIGGVDVQTLIGSATKHNYITGDDWKRLRNGGAIINDLQVSTTHIEYFSQGVSTMGDYTFKAAIAVAGGHWDMALDSAVFHVVSSAKLSVLGLGTSTALGVLFIGSDIEAQERKRKDYRELPVWIRDSVNRPPAEGIKQSADVRQLVK